MRGLKYSGPLYLYQNKEKTDVFYKIPLDGMVPRPLKVFGPYNQEKIVDVGEKRNRFGRLTKVLDIEALLKNEVEIGNILSKDGALAKI